MRLQERIPEKHAVERDWIVCSKYDNQSRFSRQHSLRDLCDHFMSTRIFTLKINQIFMEDMSSKNDEESSYNLNYDLPTILYKLRIPYPRRSGLH